MIERILQIIEYKKLNKFQFYKLTGLSNGFLDKVKDIGGSKIDLILKTFPDISTEWLLTGTGEMLKKNIATTPIITDSYVNDLQKKLIEAQELIIELQKNQLKEAAETKKTNINN